MGLCSDTRTTEGEWKIEARHMLLLQLAGISTFAVAIIGLNSWAQLFHPHLDGGLGSFAESALFGLLLAVPLFVLHELCHGLAFRRFGGCVRYGFKVLGGTPMLYATAPGHWLTRREYVVVAIAPTIALTAATVATLPIFDSVRAAVIVASAFHLSGCVGDWWTISVLKRLPSGLEYEDIITGFRYRQRSSARR